MAEKSGDIESRSQGRRPRSKEDEDEFSNPTSDVHNVAMKIERAREACRTYEGFEERPTKNEVFGWFLYDFCSYFIHTVLIPIVFPLIISQASSKPPEPAQGWETSYKGLSCEANEMMLYQGVTYGTIKVTDSTFSPLEWTSISWAIGLVLAGPVLGTISVHLDYGQYQQLVAVIATATGAIFCLPAGFFKTTRIFPPYVALIVVANSISTAYHSSHLGVMVRGFIGSTIRKSQFPNRRAMASWLSVYATAAGCFGSAIICSFTYHMLSRKDSFTSLWIVSIFSGLIWIAGIVHVFSANRPSTGTDSSSSPIPWGHVFSIFGYPHAAGSLSGVFLSSFATMCIFTAGVLYAVGYICIKPAHLLYLWLTYFIFPLFSLPLVQPLQQIIRADAVKMQLLGFLLSIMTSGFGFYYRDKNWHLHHILIFAAIQGTGTGLLHAFCRVLLLDCSPAGKEGAFSAWFSWVRAVGSLLGFVLASAGTGNIGRSFGVSFCSALVGIVVLIFGNIDNFRGAKAAGHVREHSEKGSPVHGLDHGVEVKQNVHLAAPKQEKIEV